MRESIQFIHAADLHLDSPFIGLKHLPSEIAEIMRESTFISFSRLITYAMKRKVDFVLLSGDLFDEEDRSLKAQLKLKKEFERLENVGIDVYVIHGNHDHMGGTWIELDWPENVHVFSSDAVEMKTFKKNNKPLAHIYGYSYPTRVVHRNMTFQYERTDHSSVYHIGMLHGSIEGDMEHDVYCPFKVSDLLAKDFDYWALGHIHKRQILHEDPPIVYPGNIQGRHRKEEGEKGFYLVEMSEEGPKVTFQSVEEVIWDKISMSIDQLSSLSDLMKKCETIIEQLRQRGKSTFITIELTGSSPLAKQLNTTQTLKDITDMLNEAETDFNPFIWVINITNHTYEKDKAHPKLSSFFDDLHQSVEQYQSVSTVLQPLMQHPIFRRYISEFTEEEQRRLLREAEQYLRQEILQQQSEVNRR